MLAQLVARMEHSKFGNVVVSLTDLGSLGDGLCSKGIPVHVLGMRVGLTGILEFVRLVRLLRRERPHALRPGFTMLICSASPPARWPACR